MLFLDEPTSGLDSFAALSIVRHLSSLAQDGGQTVIASIHQPRIGIWNMLDKVRGPVFTCIYRRFSFNGVGNEDSMQCAKCESGASLGRFVVDLLPRELSSLLMYVAMHTSALSQAMEVYIETQCWYIEKSPFCYSVPASALV